MRPPERIDQILELIGVIWKKNPNMRFMQLLYILQMECAELIQPLRLDTME